MIKVIFFTLKLYSFFIIYIFAYCKYYGRRSLELLIKHHSFSKLKRKMQKINVYRSRRCTMNTIFNSLSTENKKQLLQFNYDYFFYYLLMNSDDIRLILCRYISGDDSIISTAVINSETYKPRFDVY